VRSVSFDRVADRYDASRGGLERGRWLAGEIAPHLRPGHVLEVGVGTGAVALPLRELGHDVVGVDLSPSMLAVAGRRLGPVVAVGDGYRLPFGDGSVPNVVIVWVLQLVSDVTGFLAAARRVLAAEGVLVAVVDGRGDDLDDIDTVMVPVVETLRPRQDRPEQVVAAAEDAGLGLVRSEQLHREWTSSPQEQADLVEHRAYSYLWDVPDDVWQRVVVPAVATLRELPDPGRARTRIATQRLLVFSAVPSAG
jgi:ubiquinone/menaquinone biosynthesis C-methylase UbiE